MSIRMYTDADLPHRDTFSQTLLSIYTYLITTQSVASVVSSELDRRRFEKMCLTLV